jgi:hypothetical protein
MPSQSLTLTNTIHLRDFVDEVTDDPTRTDINHIEIRTHINIFEEGRFCSSGIIVEPIHARIRVYATQVERDLYVPNAIFYADGRFSTTVTSDNELQITIHALSLMRQVIFHLSCSLNLKIYLPDFG